MIGRIKNNPFYRNNLVLFFGTLMGSAFNYFFHFIVGRSVSPQIYGEIESLIAILGIISVPAVAITLIVTQTSSAFKAENNTQANYRFFWKFMKIIAYLGLPAILFLMLLAPWISGFINIEKYWALDLIWIMMLLSFFGAAASGVLNGWQKFFASSAAGVVGAAMKLISVLVFLSLGYIFLGTLMSFAIGIAISLIISVWALRFMRYEKEKDVSDDDAIIKSRFLDAKKYIWPFIAGNLSISILSNADMVMAKHNLDPVSAGNYGALMISAKIIFFLTGMIATVLFSMAAEENHRKKSSRKLGFEALRLMLLATASLTLLYFIFPKFILSLMFGNKYHLVAPYLGWFAIAVSLLSLNNMFFQYLLSVKKTIVSWWLSGVALLMTISMLLFGKNIISIIIILAAAQAIAIVVEILCLFKGRYKKIIPDAYEELRIEN
jgi:O-antigen/teichoic acid export membrane protein